MNYQKIYDSLIEKARLSNRNKTEEYFEAHHVVPRCLGGDNSIKNLVLLTPEEHFVAHQLLIKIYPNHSGLIWAAISLAANPSGGRTTNKIFGWLRKEHAKQVSIRNIGRKASPETLERMRQVRLGSTHTEKTKALISKINAGKIVSDESRAKMSASQKGLKKSEDHKRKLSEARIGSKASEETKKKLSDMRKGKPKSEAHKEKIAEANRGKKFSEERIRNMVEGKKRKAEERRLAENSIPIHNRDNQG